MLFVLALVTTAQCGVRSAQCPTRQTGQTAARAVVSVDRATSLRPASLRLRTAHSPVRTSLADRARQEELAFILDWRRWERTGRTHLVGLRSGSLHCHYDEWPKRYEDQLIRDPFTIKSMCPI